MLLKALLIRKAVAEAVGTFVMVFTGCGALAVADRFPGSIPSGAVPVIFGLAVASMIYAVGHISGAHFNPAVTLAFAVARHFPKKELPLYWIAQFVGALLAVGILSLALPPGNVFGATSPSIPVFQGLVWEIVLTFCLMFVITAVATDTRAVGTMAGAAIGATVMIGAFTGGPISGASMNPARSLAPALFEAQFSHLWIYFIGPAVGAILAALLYEWIRCDVNAGQTEKKNAKGCC